MKKVDSSFDIWSPWMLRALQLAALGDGCTSPNPLVGAVVLDNAGQLVGEGFHACAGKPHAEAIALQQAGKKAKGGTLVVTLEPCCHQGKTPPCTESILKSGISRVVVAMEDPDPRVSGSGISRLRDGGVHVLVGLFENQAAHQNRAFVFRVRNGRPWGILKWAMSLDGRIALPNGVSRWISSQEARSWVHSLRSICDAVIVGGGTVRSDNPLLTSRGLSSPEPLRVVLTRSLNLPSNAQLWNTSRAKTLIAYGSDASRDSLLQLPAAPELLPLKSADPLELLNALSGKGCNRVLWECGPGLATSAIQKGCVQELAVVVAPKILGGTSAMNPLDSLGFTSMKEVLHTSNDSVKQLGQDWLFRNILLDQEV